MKRNVVYYLAASVALLTVLIYLVTLQNEFLAWDDGPYVVDNLYIRSFDAAFFKWAFLDFYAANWHPLTWISHALDYAIWGLKPGGHHLTNVILHAVNTFIVVLLVKRLFDAFRKQTTLSERSPETHERTALIAAGVTGLLFGLHPMHVESVAWVAERKDLLCALFFLLGIITYTSYVREGGPEAAQAGTFSLFLDKRYLSTLGLFILALLSKPMAVTLPVVLLILDWFPFKRIRSVKTFWTSCVEKLPFFALSLASSIVTIEAQKSAKAVWEALSLQTRALVANQSLFAYIGKMAFPLDLMPYYPYPQTVSFLSIECLTAFALVIGITTACIVVSKKQGLWLAVWSYYVVTLLPVIGIVQVGGQSMADRYTYLPGLGPFLIIGLTSAWLTDRVNTLGRAALIAKIAGGTAAVLIVLTLSYLSFRQIGLWNNDVVLWTHAINKEPDRIPVAYNNRGIAFYRLGQLDRAIEDYGRAIALHPAYYEAFFNRAMAFEKTGRFDEAIENYDRAIALNPSYFEAYNNRGMVYEKLGRYDEAAIDYRKAIDLNASADVAYVNVGALYSKSSLFDKALEYFSKAIAVNPKYTAAYVNRGIVFSLLGQQDKALQDFNRAILSNQNDAMAYFNRGNCFFQMGDKGLAILDFQKACHLGSSDGCNALRSL